LADLQIHIFTETHFTFRIQDAAAFMIMDPEHKMLNILQQMVQLYAFMFPV